MREEFAVFPVFPGPRSRLVICGVRADKSGFSWIARFCCLLSHAVVGLGLGNDDVESSCDIMQGDSVVIQQD